VTEDLGVNELKANPPYPPLGKGANKGSFCKGAGAKRLRIFNQDILSSSAEILSANLLTNAQDDKIKSPLPPLLVCSCLTGLRARLSALTLRPQLASRFTKGGKKVAFTLAEGATHVDTFHDIRKPAFTLAEVLVTLGIIGIVAAMTLPMLAKNYQFYVRQQQFKKAYAALEIAVQKTQIDLGEGVKCNYFEGSSAGWNINQFSECAYFYQELAKNLNLIKTCNGNSLEDGCLPKDFRGGDKVYAEVQGGNDKVAAEKEFNKGCSGFSDTKVKNTSTTFIVNSGFYFIPYNYTNYSAVYGGLFLLDVNGHKGPNKWGHDIFVFMLNKKSRLDSVFNVIPSFGCNPLDSGGYYTKHFVEYLYGRNAEL